MRPAPRRRPPSCLDPLQERRPRVAPSTLTHDDQACVAVELERPAFGMPEHNATTHGHELAPGQLRQRALAFIQLGPRWIGDEQLVRSEPYEVAPGALQLGAYDAHPSGHAERFGIVRDAGEGRASTFDEHRVRGSPRQGLEPERPRPGVEVRHPTFDRSQDGKPRFAYAVGGGP